MRITEKYPQGHRFAEIVCEDPDNTLRRKGEQRTKLDRIECATIEAADLDNWEEAPIDPYTKAEYDQKVNELVRRKYSESEEMAIQRKMLALMLKPEPMTLAEDGTDTTPPALREFSDYNAYAESCKVEARASLSQRSEQV